MKNLAIVHVLVCPMYRARSFGIFAKTGVNRPCDYPFKSIYRILGPAGIYEAEDERSGKTGCGVAVLYSTVSCNSGDRGREPAHTLSLRQSLGISSGSRILFQSVFP
jgi:hypothetical protein